MRSDLAGKKFGRLTIREVLPDYRCLCDCDCGATGLIKRYHGLLYGNTSSCGCLKTLILKQRATHGDTRESGWAAEYHSWSTMVARCCNENNPNYRDYGGRGITVCQEWRNSYAHFLADMGRRPSPRHTIERLDNDKNYEKSNCCWATRKEQARNRRSTQRLTAFGKTMTIAEWAEAQGMNMMTLKNRIRRHGWDAEKALTRHLQTNSERRESARKLAAVRWSKVREAQNNAV